MDHGVVQRWLRQVLGPYAEQDRVYADVDRTLQSIPSLSPKTEVYTYDDGRSQLLLVLMGTIPIQYRGKTYNIPVSIWVPREYPRQPPMPYVTPTNDMLVRKGKHVELDGRVGGNYLDLWRRKWEACNLLDLIHDCQAIFGQEPPVYAKPKGPVSSPRSSASPAPGIASTSSPRNSFSAVHPSRGVMPPTADGTRRPLSMSSDPRERGPPPPPGHSSASPVDGPPQRPPKVGQNFAHEEARRFSNGSIYNGNGPVSPHHGRQYREYSANYGSPQPGQSARLTAEPGQMGPIGSPTARYGQEVHHAGRHASWNGSGAPPVQPPYANGSHVGGPSRPASQSTMPGEHAQTGPPPLPPLPRGHAQPGQAGFGAVGPPMPYPGQESVSPSSLLHGGMALPGNAPPPPRPPNPEMLHMHSLLHGKIQARLQHLHATSEASQAQLNLLAEDLDRGEMAIKDEMARLEAVRDVCRTTGDRLEETVHAARARVADLEAREQPDVDGLLVATSLVGNQLIDLVAEDNAIEDTLYHLGRALSSDVLDLDRFLKQTRFLAREQFLRRALAQKIGQGMGWETTA